METTNKKILFQDYFSKQIQPQQIQPSTQITPQAQTQQITQKQNNHTQTGQQKKEFNSKIFQQDFVTYIVGPPKSGKSTILAYMLTCKEMYGDYFNKVFYISPTKFTMDQNEDVNWIKTVDLQRIYQTISDINKMKNIGYKLCIVFDDVVSELNQLSRDKLMMPLILNRRHLIENGGEISFFITSQKYNMLPLKYRVQITSAILFFVCPKEWSDIKQEIIKHQDLKQIERIIQKTCSGPHKFIYIHNTNPIQLFDETFNEIMIF